MNEVLIILFWAAVLAVFHTYILFPFILKVFSSVKMENENVFEASELPQISIIIAAHNEEHVIAQKIESIYKTTYPTDKIDVLIGSDCSNDHTNAIIKEHQSKYSSLQLKAYETRQGKANIVNELVELAKGEVLVLTDANVFFEEETLFQLIKHFKNDSIGLVGANIVNTNLKKSGISVQEKDYLNWDKEIKYREGLLWGAMIGAFGGAYAIRKNLYKPVPEGYLMDDFYITMHVLELKKRSIFEKEATCLEDVSDKISEEFRRKKRISAGNFQNLSSYKHLLWSSSFGVMFSFMSHKVLRWLTPFFILIALGTSAWLSINSELYFYLFLLQLSVFVILPLDWILRQMKLNFGVLRFVTHFMSMNLALFFGFFKYLFGVKSNVWKPTERNQ